MIKYDDITRRIIEIIDLKPIVYEDMNWFQTQLGGVVLRAP